MLNFILQLLFLLYLCCYCVCIEPVTMATGITAGVVSVGFASYKYLHCVKYECCADPWVKFNLNGLNSDFHEKVFGQHLVMDIVPRAIKAHMNKEEPPKALVMSFHGWTGSGKNLVSMLIAKNLFYNGPKSQYHHLFLGSNLVHVEDIYKYKVKIRDDVEKATKKCERNLFIFDEVDKMAPGVLDVLTPYVDYHESIDGVDYRKNIFIFLSNAGGTNITNVAVKFWAEGMDRTKIKLRDVERVITLGAFNEEGGLRRSDIVKKDLIDVYVPFLPLERKHVKLCIEAELIKQGKKVTKDIVSKIADQLVYSPEEVEIFSVSGCKKVSAKVDLFAD